MHQVQANVLRTAVAGLCHDGCGLVEGEQVVGFRLSKIKPDTKAASFGLYNGDVIKSVNGVSAVESELFMQTVRELADPSEITLEIDRYGRLITYTYILE